MTKEATLMVALWAVLMTGPDRLTGLCGGIQWAPFDGYRIKGHCVWLHSYIIIYGVANCEIIMDYVLLLVALGGFVEGAF